MEFHGRLSVEMISIYSLSVLERDYEINKAISWT
jgi:hypothetical protein